MGLLKAQTQPVLPPSISGPDVLIFVDGEKLIGHFEHATDKSITFKSDMAGEITADWSKVSQLQSSQKFAVLEKGLKLKPSSFAVSQVPQGTIEANDKDILVTTSPATVPVTVSLSNTADVIDAAAFQAALRRPGLLQDWKGVATVGISLVTATQDNRTYTSNVSLRRIIPIVDWMDPSSRTTLNFTSSYGSISQPGTATVKTSIYHADAERDQYFSPSVYAFTEAGFQHDYSQGLDLQQTYGGGIGWTAVKGPNEQLDFKGELTYVNQMFFSSAENQKLLGSVIAEGYDHKFKHNIIFHQQLSVSPAITNTRAYSATGNVSLSMPVIKRISLTTSTLDTFLNDPSPGYRKNSFQFTTGLTYTLP